jgi:hypothetical protein
MRTDRNLLWKGVGRKFPHLVPTPSLTSSPSACTNKQSDASEKERKERGKTGNGSLEKENRKSVSEMIML